ncbi:MAG: hypothetical protein ACOCUQ_03625 [Bacteroidota bacterium]
MLQEKFLQRANYGFPIREDNHFNFFFTPLLMQESEVFNDNKNIQPNNGKSDLYQSASYQLDEKINFSNTTYHQPGFNSFNQFSLSSKTLAEMKFNKSFYFCTNTD